MAEVERKQINQYFNGLPANSSPSSATNLVAEENGESKKIPIDSFVRKDADGNVTMGGDLTTEGGITVKGASTLEDSVDVKYGNIIRFWNDDNSKFVDICCDNEGNLLGKGDIPIATEAYVDEKCGHYDCTVHPGSTMRDLLNDLKSKGYTPGDTMILSLHRSQSGGQSGRYVGYIESFAGDSNCRFYLFEFTTATLYSVTNGVTTSTNLVTLFENAAKSGAELFKDVELLPQDPSETVFYRTPEVLSAKWVFNRAIVTDGGMKCHVVDELPEVGEPCYTGETMCSYFRRSTYSVHGYVDSDVSQMMNVPVGWHSAYSLFEAVGFNLSGMITSLDQVSNDDYYLLLETSFKLHCYAKPLGTMVKVTIPTEESIKAYIDETILGGSW